MQKKTVMRRVFLCFSAKAAAHGDNYDGSVYLREDSVTSIDQPEEKNCNELFQGYTSLSSRTAYVSVSVLLFTHVSGSRCFTLPGFLCIFMKVTD